MRRQATSYINKDLHIVFYANQLNHIVKMSDIRMKNFVDTYKIKGAQGVELL